MTAYTPQSTVGALFIQAMAPWITGPHPEQFEWYLDALGSMFDGTYDLVYDQGIDGTPGFVPGYGALLDPLLCSPADLPYLGQFVGVQVPVGQDAATALALVTAESGLARGTLASLVSAVQRSISTPWLPSTAYVAGVMFTEGNPATFYLVSTGYTSGATFGATDLANAAVVDPSTQYTIRERTDPNGNPDAYWITIRVKPEQLTPTSNSTALTAAINSVKPGGVMINLVVSDSPPWSAATLEWSAVAGTVAWGTVISGSV